MNALILPALGVIAALALASTRAHAAVGTERDEGIHAPLERGVVPTAGVRADGGESAAPILAGRLERLEIEVAGPAGASLVLIASPIEPRNAADEQGVDQTSFWPETLKPEPAASSAAKAVFAVFVDGRVDATARIGPEGLWRGRWLVPDGMPLGMRFHLEAFVLEPQGPRSLGRPREVEIVDAWTFDGGRFEGGPRVAGWSDAMPAGEGFARTRGFRCGAPDLVCRVEVHVRVEATLPDAGRGQLGRDSRSADDSEQAPLQVMFAAVASVEWPATADAAAGLEWLARAAARGAFDTADLTPAVATSQRAAQFELLAQTDGLGRLWLALGTVAGTSGDVDPPAVRHVRVVLRAAR